MLSKRICLIDKQTLSLFTFGRKEARRERKKNEKGKREREKEKRRRKKEK